MQLEYNLDHTTECFTQLLTEVMEHHAPVKKYTVKAHPASWVDDELSKALYSFVESNTTLDSDRQDNTKLHKYALKYNCNKKAPHQKNALTDCKMY